MKILKNMKILKKQIIKLYNDWKFESLMYKKSEIMQPKWEKNLSWLLFVAFIFFLVFNHYIFTKAVNIFLVIYLLLSFIILYNSAKRDFINVKNYYVARKQYLDTNFLLTTNRLIFTSFAFLKISKPALKTCIACVIGVNGALISVHGTYKIMWPEHKSPFEILGSKITDYTGFPPKEWEIPKDEK